MYAAQVTDGTVTQVIVGTADWANERLAGTWVDSPTLVGIGWAFEDGTFVPPPAPDDGGEDEAEAIAYAVSIGWEPETDDNV